MTETLTMRPAAIVAAALALLMALPAIGDTEQAQPPAPSSEAAPAPPMDALEPSTGDAAQMARARWEAIQQRKAALTAELNRRYEDLQREAAREGIEPLPAPPWPQEPRWLSYDEMRELMSKQGISMPPAPDFRAQSASEIDAEAPAGAQTPTPRAGAGPLGPEALKAYFDVIEQMSPAQQEACFAVARWQAGVLASHPMPPPAPLIPGALFPPESALQPGQPFPRMMSPGH